MSAVLPLDIECPHCKAEPGQECRTLSGYSSPLHKARWKASGWQDISIETEFTLKRVMKIKLEQLAESRSA